MTALEAYALAKKVAASAVSGIKNLSVNGTTLTIETNDGNTIDMVFPVPQDGKDGKDGKDGVDGRGIASTEINNSDHLIITYDDGTTEDAGLIKGAEVEVTQLLSEGIKIASISIDGVNTDLFAPQGGSGECDYYIIDEMSSLPSDLTSNDRRIYYCLEDNNFHLWNGTAWEIISSSVKVRELTQAEYDALSTAEKLNGTIYFIKDGSGGGGSGGSGSLQKAITAAIDVGGIDAGDNFAVGTSYDDMWDALLNPTLYPTFTAPSASLSYTADAYYEVGATIAAKTGTMTYNAGAITLNGVKQNNRGGAATNYTLASSGADTEYSESSTSSGTFDVSALTRASKGTITLTATVSYAEGPQPKDSKGNNYDNPLPAGSKTATKTMTFIQPYYYGKSSTSTVSDFTGLTKSVTAKGQKQFKFTTNNEYMVFAYDSSYGNLSSIIDPNGFETISGWTKSTLTVNGFSYYVYVSNSATTDTNAQFTFKY